MANELSTQYLGKLKDPRWQKKRLEIFERDEWTCQICDSKETTLCVHHRVYLKDKEPWEYDNSLLVTLCEDCHEEESKQIKSYLYALESIFRLNFFSNDIYKLWRGFYSLRRDFPSDITSSVLEWVLRNPDEMEILLGKYFQHLSEKQKSV